MEWLSVYKKSFEDSKVYVLLGDGECQEGQVWEAAMSAVQYKLSNVIAIIDRNKVQLDGNVNDIKNLGDLEGRWKAIGWNVLTIDGHNISEIITALETSSNSSAPTLIIANTIKGKGVPFMEGKHNYHGAVPSCSEMEQEIRRMKETK